MSNFNIEALRTAVNKTDYQSQGKLYYPIWDMEDGDSAVIRFLPDLNTKNPMGFLVEKTVHNIQVNWESKNVPCLQMYGEKCPICAASKSFYDAGDQVNGKQYWRRKWYYAQVLVVKDNRRAGEKCDGRVMLLNVGYQLFNVIKAALASSLSSAPFDYVTGCDFVLKKTGSDKYAGFVAGSGFIKPARALSDEELALAESKIINLSILLPPNPGVEKLKAMLDASLRGTKYEEPQPKAWKFEDEVKDDGDGNPVTIQTPKSVVVNPVHRDDQDYTHEIVPVECANGQDDMYEFPVWADKPDDDVWVAAIKRLVKANPQS